MNTFRGTATATGVLYILAAAASIAGLLLYGPVLDDPLYVVGGRPHGAELASGALLEMVLAFSVIGTGVVMFPVVRRLSESVALGYACFRLLEAAVIVVGVVSVLSVLTLGRDFSAAADPQPAAYLGAGRALVAVHDWTFLAGPNLALGPSTLMMGWFLHRSRLVPRFIAVMGMVGGPLIFASAVLVLFGVYEQISLWGSLAALPVFAYEMALAGRLVVRGFDRAAVARLLAREA
ncbi:hypothetical protein KNE206_37550 [Kitasatospora sp. NE20-6]|uniref:DUF4386 domain-containing protein n=1 Tax=Kitasatospora sp. NE20-6 TaxID=2859066 RepID=UPI0034DBB1BD